MKKLQDYYFKKAKEDNYFARSVYKLEEIDKRYHIIKKEIKVLDIGCAPGSWSQYILKKIGNGQVLGIDINKNINISDDRFSFMIGDIFKINEETLLKRFKLFDLIVSDAAPKTSGDKFIDSQNSLRIVKRVFELAEKILRIDGSIVAKVFQGEDLKTFLYSVKVDFKKINLFKPKSSRKESKEIFIIAIGRRFKS